jgi:leucyl-tRNA synthetase
MERTHVERASLTPHLAEEMWESMGGEGLVSAARLPEPSEEAIDPMAEAREELVRGTLQDVMEILKVTRMEPSTVYLYAAPRWKARAVELAVSTGAREVGDLMEAASGDAALKPHLSTLSRYAPRLLERIRGLKADRLEVLAAPIDEREVLDAARPFLEEELGARVVVSEADSEDVYDPEGRAAKADVRKPGIFLE